MFMDNDSFGEGVEEKTSTYSSSSAGSNGGVNMSSAENRQRAQLQQRQMALKRQNSRRSSSGAVQSNRAFMGSSRKISARTGVRQFSAPKAIDPLEGEESPSIPVRKGYANSYRGGYNSRSSANYGGVYEAGYGDDSYSNSQPRNEAISVLPNEIPDESPRASQNTQRSNSRDQYESKAQDHTSWGTHSQKNPKFSQEQQYQKQTYPKEDYETEAPVHRTQPKSREKFKNKNQRNDYQSNTSAGEDIESKSNEPLQREGRRAKQKSVERDMLERGISTSYDPNPSSEDEEPTFHKSKTSKPKLPPRKKKTLEEGEEKRISDEEELEQKAEIKKNEVMSRSKKNKKKNKKNPNSDSEAAEEEESDQEESLLTKLDLSDMRTFLLRSSPKPTGTVQCYIERNKVGVSNKLYPEYYLYLKEGDRFLLAAKKRAKNRTSNYMISMDQKGFSKNSGNYIGKLRSNFLGTEFQIFDKGQNPKNSDPDSLRVTNKSVREELGTILYASNVLGSRGPRKMKVAIPTVKEDGSRIVCKATRKSDSVLNRFKDRDMEELTELINKPPRWNDQVGAYVLNFNGRVTMASVKNFQLVVPEDEDKIVLQFGRVGKDLFTMDYAHPLSPLQAFSICLSSFDSKLACE